MNLTDQPTPQTDAISLTKLPMNHPQSPLLPEKKSIPQLEEEAYQFGFRIGFIVAVFLCVLFGIVAFLILKSIYGF